MVEMKYAEEFPHCIKASQILIAVMVVFLFLGAVHAPNLATASNSANVCCGFYSCLGADVTFFWRQRRAHEVVERLERLYKEVDKIAQSSGEREALTRASRMDHKMTQLQVWFGLMMVGSVWAQVCLTGRAYCPIWPMPETDYGQLPYIKNEKLRTGKKLAFSKNAKILVTKDPNEFTVSRCCSAIGVIEMITMFVGCTGFYAAGALIGTITTSMMGMFNALSSRLETRLGNTRYSDVLQVVKLHQELCVVSKEVEALFSDSITHYMLCCFSVPLMSTLQVLHNNLQFLTFTGAFINLAVFMPLATLSQRLSDASVSVRTGAYTAAMAVRGEETVSSRRALQLVLLAAGRPARLSFKGLGPLTLSSAGNALRAWYSFTNVLVKVG